MIFVPHPSIIVNLPSMRSEPKEAFEKRLEKWKANGEEARRLEAAFECGEAGISEEAVRAAQRGSQGEKPKRECAEYVKHRARSLTLEQFKTFAADMNMLSMIQVRWHFSERPRRAARSETGISRKQKVAIALSLWFFEQVQKSCPILRPPCSA